MNNIKNEYYLKCAVSSDINEHLPTLYRYATECESVFETGVRGVISSWALALGLLNNNSPEKYLFLNDISPCRIENLVKQCSETELKVDYEWINNLDYTPTRKFDMIFIDTWHVYGQLKRELDKFHSHVNKYIIMHDTTVDEWIGETIRCGFNPQIQSAESGFEVSEITCGLWPAIKEFLTLHPEWYIKERFTNNNGLTILARH